jgi:hypothetical protein
VDGPSSPSEEFGFFRARGSKLPQVKAQATPNLTGGAKYPFTLNRKNEQLS